jgi:hypothetical protein
VFVNGFEKKLLKANYLFKAVELSPKDKLVSFIYKPKMFFIGMWVTLIFILFIGAISIVIISKNIVFEGNIKNDRFSHIKQK